MKLLVICEAKFDMKTNGTVHLAMKEILKQYQNFFDEVHCLCPGETKQIGVLSDFGVIFHTVDYYRGSKLNKLSSLFKGDKNFIKQIVKQYDIDVIQYRIPSFFGLGLYNCCRSIGAVKTTYIAGDMYESLINNFKRIPFVKLFARFSEFLQNKLIRNSIVISTGDVLARKYNYLNPNIHAYYSTTHNDIVSNANTEIGNILKIVFLGRIDEAKRLVDLIDATKYLNENSIDFFVNIIGDGPSLQSIKELVTLHGISAKFKFHGYVSDRKTIDDILCNSQVIVLPSVTEGTAKVLPEAMSRGVIPIAVNGVGSNNYIIKDGENGYLFDKYDSKGLAEIFVKILKSNNNYLTMRSNCYNYAEDRTASKEIRKMWEFVFNNIK